MKPCAEFSAGETFDLWNKMKKVVPGTDFKEFYSGVLHEREHIDVVGCSITKIAKIALAHLKEDPHYYEHLSTMEAKFRAR
jgi:hypothetical protein